MTEVKKSLSISTLLVLAITALMPMAVATGFSNFERARHVVLGVLAALALVSWAIGVFRQKEITIASPGTVVLGGAFGLVVGGSVLWSNVALFGALSAVMWAALGVIFLVLVAPVGRAADFRDWTTALAAAAIAAGGMGVYDFLGGELLNPVWRPSGVAGGFDSLEFAAAFYALVIPVLAGAVAVSEGNRQRFMGLGLVLAAIHFALVADGLVLVVVAGALVSVAVLVRITSGSGAGRIGKVAAGATVVALAVALAGVTLVERPTFESDAVDLPRLSPTDGFDIEMAADPEVRWPYFAADRMESPLDQRYRSYLNAVIRGQWQNEPVIGHGAGGWGLMQTDVIHEGDPVVRAQFHRYADFASPHNDYGRVLVEQGVLGLILFLLWLAGIGTAALGGIRSGAKDDEERVVIWALTSTVVTGLVLMFFMPVLELGSSAVVWIGAAALAVAFSARRVSDNKWLEVKSVGVGPVPAVVLTVGAVAVAGAMLWPTVMNGMASLERGYGDHLMVRSQFDRAIPHYEKAHSLYPAHGEVLLNIASAHMLRGASVEGYDAIMEAAEMRPYDSRILTQASFLNIQTERIDTALAMGGEAVRVGPNYMRAYDVYAAALQRRSRYIETVMLLKAALDREPPHESKATIYSRLGIIYDGQLHEPELAQEYMQKAIEALSPGPERELLVYRLNELSKRVEREKLEAEGKPIPPELMPEQHDHGHHHH